MLTIFTSSHFVFLAISNNFTGSGKNKQIGHDIYYDVIKKSIEWIFSFRVYIIYTSLDPHILL